MNPNHQKINPKPKSPPYRIFLYRIFLCFALLPLLISCSAKRSALKITSLDQVELPPKIKKKPTPTPNLSKLPKLSKSKTQKLPSLSKLSKLSKSKLQKLPPLSKSKLQKLPSLSKSKLQKLPPISKSKLQKLPSLSKSKLQKLPPLSKSKLQKLPSLSKSKLQKLPSLSKSKLQKLPSISKSKLQKPPPISKSKLQKLPPISKSKLQKPPPISKSKLQKPPPISKSKLQKPPPISKSKLQKPPPISKPKLPELKPLEQVFQNLNVKLKKTKPSKFLKLRFFNPLGYQITLPQSFSQNIDRPQMWSFTQKTPSSQIKILIGTASNPQITPFTTIVQNIKQQYSSKMNIQWLSKSLPIPAVNPKKYQASQVQNILGLVSSPDNQKNLVLIQLLRNLQKTKTVILTTILSETIPKNISLSNPITSIFNQKRINLIFLILKSFTFF